MVLNKVYPPVSFPFPSPLTGWVEERLLVPV